MTTLAEAAVRAAELADAGDERALSQLRAQWDDELEAAARAKDFRERAAAFRAVGQFRFRQKTELLRRGLDDDSPAHAQVHAVRETGKEALAELRRQLGLLGATGDGPVPMPGVDDLARLAETHGAEFAHEGGDGREIPPGLGLAAFRVVQEALTNASRHAVSSSPANANSSGSGACSVSSRCASSEARPPCCSSGWWPPCCSSSTWKFDPPMPNALTPARRGCSGRLGQSVVARTTSMRAAAKSIFLLGVSQCSEAGILPVSSASTLLVSAGAPAAAMRCPRFDFTEPMRSGARRRAPP